MKEGFIALYRSLLDWEWYSDPVVSRLFIHCLLKANYRPKKWQGQMIQRGQFVSSRSKLAAELGLSEQQIRTAISKLESTNELTKHGRSQSTVFTVVSYDSYQLSTSGSTNEQPAIQPTDQPTDQPANNQEKIEESNQQSTSENPCDTGVSDESTNISNQQITSLIHSAPTNDSTNGSTSGATTTNKLNNSLSFNSAQWSLSDGVRDSLSKMNGVPTEFIQERVTPFLAYWNDRGDELTQGQWDSKFSSDCINRWRNDRDQWRQQSNENNLNSGQQGRVTKLSTVERASEQNEAYLRELQQRIEREG